MKGILMLCTNMFLLGLADFFFENNGVVTSSSRESYDGIRKIYIIKLKKVHQLLEKICGRKNFLCKRWCIISMLNNCYVNDHLASGRVNYILSVMNNFDVNIQFSYETKTECKLPFLDLLFHRKGNKETNSAYRN